MRKHSSLTHIHIRRIFCFAAKRLLERMGHTHTHTHQPFPYIRRVLFFFNAERGLKTDGTGHTHQLLPMYTNSIYLVVFDRPRRPEIWFLAYTLALPSASCSASIISCFSCRVRCDKVLLVVDRSGVCGWPRISIRTSFHDQSVEKKKSARGAVKKRGMLLCGVSTCRGSHDTRWHTQP